MSLGHEREFGVVELIIRDGGATAGVDALTLTVIKTERQMRRLMTHAVFQSNAFERKDVAALRDLLVAQRGIYFEQLRKGFELISGLEVADLLADNTGAYDADIDKVRHTRNKLFHGQLTNEMLGTTELLERTRRLLNWSKMLGEACLDRFGYEGFDSSYVKSAHVGLSERATERVPDLGAYGEILIGLQRR